MLLVNNITQHIRTTIAFNSQVILVSLVQLTIFILLPSVARAQSSPPTGSISTTTNPIHVCDGSNLGITTLSWNSTGTTQVEVHVDSPDGTLFSNTSPSGSGTTGKWVYNGMVFYLQNVAGGLPLTADNTLATLRVNVDSVGCGGRTASFVANTNPIHVCDNTGLGVTNLSWVTTNTSLVEVHMDSPSGTLFAQSGPTGMATTGKWAQNGTTFYLQDVSGGLPLTSANTLGLLRVRVDKVGCKPSVAGQWSQPSGWGFVAIHMILLPDGKVLTWPRNGGAGARVWDPITNNFAPAHNNITNIFCSGHSFLPDGRLLVTGGHIEDNDGPNHANIFDYRTVNTSTYGWTQIGNMNAGRWYPSNCTLGNGEILVAGGTYKNSARDIIQNTLPQVWQTNSGGGWRNLTTADTALQTPAFNLPYYPWMHLAPNGKVFISGPDHTSRYLDTAGTGTWSSVADSMIYDPGINTYVAGRFNGSSVMYDNGKIMIAGGSLPGQTTLTTNTTQIIDLNSTSPTWRTVGPMAHRRTQHNATLLPDGKILVTGGTSMGSTNWLGTVYDAEMWNPDTESWSTMARMQSARLYHSTAVLLPDGRVITGGGGEPGSPNDPIVNHTDVEIFSPPYLFNSDASLAQRPTITSSPASVGYNQTFTIATPDAPNISKVTWVRLSSVTHSFNQEQRINRLSFSQVAGGLNVTSPPNRNLCPPGYYMMFVFNSSGVPSVAKMVRIG